MSTREAALYYARRGYCQCGCGEKTNIASQNSERYGWVKGEPLRFVAGHQTRVGVSTPEWDDDLQCYRIPLTGEKGKGMYALVDKEDVYKVSPGRWTVTSKGYTTYASGRLEGERSKRLLHRVILDPPPGMVIDHINGDGLDNRRSNLRITTQSGNMANARSLRGSSRFKGVSFAKGRGKWQAHIRLDGKSVSLGRFDSEEDAARAYDAAARDAFGEFALTNEEMGLL